MRASLYRATGPAAEVLELADLPHPVPSAGEVGVRLLVAGLNPTDVKARAGHRGRPLAFEHQIPGHDGAGVVDAVGAGVDPARLGQDVWVFHAALGRPHGSCAQYVVVPDWQAVPLHGADPAVGAALGIPFITAHRCLLRDGPIAGLTVLVAGGGGAVGNATVQLARRAGARVLATAGSPETAALARAAGAEHVVDHRDPHAAERLREHTPGGFHRIVEVAFGSNLETNLAVLAKGGTIVCYATEPDPVDLPLSRLIGANVRLDFVLVYLTPRPALEQATRDIAELLAEGAVITLPARRFALEDAIAAHEMLETGPRGRILLEIPAERDLRGENAPERPLS